MIITTEYNDIEVDGSPMRTFIAAPKQDGRFPGILLYSDISSANGSDNPQHAHALPVTVSSLQRRKSIIELKNPGP